ncbi:CPBP family intramembrane glutamic endopeptidase [Actinorugispora endophytica]|uniref:CAAX prenyl protease-like protein n=1 Tax=Actinorugispora endophytica TaxID=1605990 RepID=A0A4R6V4B7_9ACTN|nr:CPBP family intramembrane glutamic endopeptidase [Actinorugispora endophytica]TDQ55033.1 CAAX prenyl protease-like protein [Actinorugispora endophytica]
MEQARAWVLGAGSVLFAVCVLVVAGAEFGGTDWVDLRQTASPLWIAWVPAAAGCALLRLLPSRRGEAELDERVRRVLAGHPVGREITRLCLCLAGFLLGAAVLSWVFGVFGDALTVLGTPVARTAFLAAVPVLLVDRGGLISVGARDGMERLAIRVRDHWRWWGAVPAAVALGVLLARQWATLLPLRVEFLLVAAVVLLTIALPEEVFFRALLQTRLEAGLGKAAGVVLTALLFAATYAALNRYVDFYRADVLAVDGDYVLSIAVYGVNGLLYGYLWARYRNIWLNIALRTGVLVLILEPAVTFAV